jgi:predicted alpha/beta hydrolase
MTSTDIILTCSDGIELPATQYLSDDHCASKGVLVIAPALGVPRKIYRVFAEHCSDQGYAVICFDYRGSFPSANMKLHNQFQLQDWGCLDLNAALGYAKSLPGGDSIFLLGHSIGGQVAGLAKNLSDVKALVCVASSFPYWKRWPVPQRLYIGLLFNLLTPLIAMFSQTFPSKAMGLSANNLPSNLVAQWASWMGKDGYLLDSSFGFDDQGYQQFYRPLLSFGFDDDNMVPEASFDKLLHAYSNAKITRRFVDTHATGSIAHMGFFKAKHKDNLWQETLDWLERQSSVDNAKCEATS